MRIKTELLANAISDKIRAMLSYPYIDIDANEIANTTAINALSEIQGVLQNYNYDDFDTVEKIVRIFEKYEISAGAAHDFG